MTTTESPDRWYVNVDLWDHRTGTRRSADATITEDGDLAEEALDAVMAVMVRADQHERFLAYAENLAAAHGGGDGRAAALVLEVKCGRHRDAEVLDRVVTLMDEADWMPTAEGGPVARVAALLELVRSAEPMRPGPASESGEESAGAGDLPRSLGEPVGEDPADEAGATWRGRPVEQVDLPVSGGDVAADVRDR